MPLTHAVYFEFQSINDALDVVAELDHDHTSFLIGLSFHQERFRVSQFADGTPSPLSAEAVLPTLSS